MSKVAIVGVEGSGKTVLMAALAEQYGSISEDRPYLMPENQAAFTFMTHIPHLLRKERQWPQATSVDSLRLMKWTLRCGQEVLTEIEMLDYPGELYRLAFGERKESELAGHREEVHEFLEHLTNSETLAVLLNLKDVMELGGNHRNTETVWITRGIFDYAKKVPSIRSVVLVFTQTDRYTDILRSEGGPQALLKHFLPMLAVLHPNLECMAVSAVNGMDENGNPRGDHGSQGIQDLMDRLLTRCALKPGDISVIDLGNGVKLDLIWCPATTPSGFLMGSPTNDPQRAPDEYQHRVILTHGFWMGRYPVTQEQWNAVMGSNPSSFKTGKVLGIIGGQTQGKHPVECVSWNDSQKFIARLNSNVPGGGFRLPTETEWEYACRAGTTGPYAGDLGDMAWYTSNSGDKTHSVGQKKANDWGLYDMHGNIWEWCSDWYCVYPSETVSVPSGPESGSNRVLRGGSWKSIAMRCRSAFRGSDVPDCRNGNLGLRLARTSL